MPLIQTIPGRAAARSLILFSATAILAAASLSAASTARAATVPLRAPGLSARAATAGAAATAQPLSPQQIHAAYALPATGARGQTIAVLSLYDDPYVERDLAAYSQHFHLPACTTANGCFRKLNQSAQPRPLPPTDPSGGQWLDESALGVELAHGVCQSCRIVLIEATAPSDGDLAAGADAAAKAGATVLVTAVTPVEQPSDAAYWQSHFSHPGMAVVAASGDGQGQTYGFTGGVNFPSSLPNVLAAGGTVLSLRGGGYGAEQAWSETVSGCSTYNRAPAWQSQIAAQAGCGAARAVADVSAMAEPGAAVHVTGTDVAGGPWFQDSGTSVAAPIIAGAIGLAGSAGEDEARMLYGRIHSSGFHDIVTGKTSPSCPDTTCQAGRGWDGPTGLGTPFGLAAFLKDGGVLSPRNPGVAAAPPRRGLIFGRSWRARLALRNGNAFAVQGTLVLRRSLRVGRRVRTVALPPAPVRLGPLGAGGVTLNVPRVDRSLLRGRHLTAYVQFNVRGPAGSAARFMRAVPVAFPR